MFSISALIQSLTSLILVPKNSLEGLERHPSFLIWSITYPKTACRAVTPQASDDSALFYDVFMQMQTAVLRLQLGKLQIIRHQGRAVRGGR